ncbi:MAG: hypothetical protein KJ600_01105 [Nanoarchaeota archaeon]|nr:hypothetical protein [Nanoarchaeota archaeon]MBU1103140.1 hypothetical protein [Nanoarchaeota archaeon]
MTQRELLPAVALVALGVSILLPITDCSVRYATYLRARSYVEERIGDMQPPLTSEETERWHKLMGVEEGKNPERHHYSKYLKDVFAEIKAEGH